VARQHPFYGEAARRGGGPGWTGFGRGRGHGLGRLDDVFGCAGDRAGVARWARDRGWVEVPADDRPPVVGELLAGAPVPLGPEHVAVDLRTGVHAGWSVLAFDVVVRTGQGDVPEWAVTALGRPRTADPYHLHPRRLGAFALPGRGRSVDVGPGELADRWTATGAPDVARVLQQAAAREALLGTDDGDEVWATATALAAVRPDGHRPALLEHHLPLLAALAGAEQECGRP
jgi:hypothetical protein